MEEIAKSIVGQVTEALVKAVGHQFNSLRFTTNITNLKRKAEELENAEGDLQDRVKRARDNVEIIPSEVEDWLTKSNEIKGLKNTILDEVPNVESGYLKVRARLSLSKRAKKITDRIIEHLGKKNFDVISYPGRPAAVEPVPLGTAYEFESRKQIEEDIMTSLRGSGGVNMIGICGMGGLGKTTMAKRLMNRALKDRVFDEVVIAVVSQQADKSKIQVEIGGSLGLKLEGETWQTRVQKLSARLSGTEKILLVLDDVWERLVLEDLGIPRGCRILLTSRNSDTLSRMNVEKVFGIKVLSEEEAWFLFRERAGTCVDDNGLHSIAQQIVEECRGLPIALTTVGATLKDEENVSIWKDALRQLRKCDPDIPEVIAEVYNSLKLSYDVLGSRHAKSVFLLCCLFREDANIPVEELTYFCMGLGIFEGGMEEARNRMCALTKMLKSPSLLLDSDEDDCVSMHDVVRDVCIFIAKQEGCIGGNDCTWISSSLQQVGEGTKLPTNLRLLFLIGDNPTNPLDNSILEGIRYLHVLSIENYSSLASLPHTTQSLRNLNTLVLQSCKRLETISVVGELVNLEILICRDCYSIKELPLGIKGLNLLKLLDLTRCHNLERIGGGIISSLVRLEELKMLYSFRKWEATWDIEERENGNAGLRELESLINLRCLEIQIEDPALAAQNMCLSSNLDRFHIETYPALFSSGKFSSISSNKKLSLKWDGETHLGDWIKMQLLRDAECLRLSGNGANNVDHLAKSENIRWLELNWCETMKNIGRTSLMHNDGRYGVFPHMEYLKLSSLPQLEEIWDGPISSNSFQNLKELNLSYLPTLKQFWKSNLGQFSIAQLEILVIRDCKMMEQVFLWNEEEDQNRSNSESRITKMFPKLKEVDFDELPNLATFCQGIEGIEFPLLTRMIEKCQKMTSMVSSNEKKAGGSSNADIHYSHLFCPPQKVSFGNLKSLVTDRNPFCGHNIDVSLFIRLEKLYISGCESNMSLFSSSIAGNLVNLKELRIEVCDELVQVIKDEEEKAVSGDGQSTSLLFPKLQELFLRDLPKLVSFCEWKCDVELPSLRKVHIRDCPNMKNFSLGSLVALILETFYSVSNNYLEVPFHNLKQLTIFDYEGNISLFSASIAGNLVNLKELGIHGCDELVQVIKDEEEKAVSGDGQRTPLLFPKLQELELGNLPELVSFCEWKCDVELPSLRIVEISYCRNMQHFTLGLLTTPKLEIVTIDSVDFGGVKDLNDTLQQHYLAQAKEEEEEEESDEEEQETKGDQIEEEHNS